MYTPDFENIRENIITQLETISKAELDTSDYSYINQLVNLIAIADDALLFYVSMLLNELSFDNAMLPDTINETANLFGVDSKFGSPSSNKLKVYVNIPELTQDINAIITSNITAMSDSIIFKPLYDYTIQYRNVTMSSFVSAKQKDNAIPVHSNIETIDGQSFVSFEIEVRQREEVEIDINLEDNINEYELVLDTSDYICDIEVHVDGIFYNRVFNVSQLGINNYTLKSYDKGYKLIFNTEFSGKQLLVSQNLKIVYGKTKGYNGNVKSNTIQLDSLSDILSGLELQLIVQHTTFINGYDPLSLLELKDKIHSLLLSRNILMSTDYDFSNIKTFLKGYSKYPALVPNVSITPKIVVYTELELDNTITETNTIMIENFNSNKEISQGCVIGEVDEIGLANYDNSSDNGISELILANSKVCVVSPFKLRYNALKNIVEYFIYSPGGSVNMNPVYSKVSNYDLITNVVPMLATVNYLADTKEEHIRIMLKANAMDINELLDPSLFEVRVTLEKEVFGRMVDDAIFSNTINAINKADISINDQGSPEIELFANIMMFEADVNYTFRVRLYYREELITDYVSNKIKLYDKTPLYSPVKRGSITKFYTPASAIHNDAIVYDSNGLNKTPIGFRSKINFEISPSSAKISVTLNEDSVAFDLRQISSANISFNSEMFTMAIESAYAAQLKLRLDFPTNFNINKALDYSLNLFAADNIISYNGPLPLDELSGNANMTIYQVPVVSYDVWKKLENEESISLISDKLLKIHKHLQDYKLFGTDINVKFLRTYGHVSNIRYNKKYTYDYKYISTHAIKLPIDIRMKLITNENFNEIEAYNEIESILKESFESNLYPINGFVLSEINSLLTAKIKGLISVQFITPYTDVIYDYSINALGRNLNEYVPELIYLNNISYED